SRPQPKYRGLVHGAQASAGYLLGVCDLLSWHSSLSAIFSFPRLTRPGVATIVRTEGPLGIYRGLFPVMPRQGANQAVRFSVYSTAKRWVQTHQSPGQPIHWGTTFVIGMLAGTVTVYTTMPLDVVKTKMQGIGAKELYRNSLRCAMSVLREEGILAFW